MRRPPSWPRSFRDRLARQLRVHVSRRGEPVRLDPYLGAMGHSVALREGDLAFLHVRPDEHSPTVAAELPSAGRHRPFLQFELRGRVRTAALTEVVG